MVRKLGSVDLSNPTRALPAVAARDRGEHRYDHTPRIWWLNVLALLGLTMAGLVGAGMLLDRRARDGP